MRGEVENNARQPVMLSSKSFIRQYTMLYRESCLMIYNQGSGCGPSHLFAQRHLRRLPSRYFSWTLRVLEVVLNVLMSILNLLFGYYPGMFDNETTMTLTAQIFGLSTLVSSFQIYNVDKRIQEDNLQHLALFSEYGRMALLPQVNQVYHRQLLLPR